MNNGGRQLYTEERPARTDGAPPSMRSGRGPASSNRRRRNRFRRRLIIGISGGVLAVLCGLMVWGVVYLLTGGSRIDLSGIAIPSWIEPHLLDLDGDARDGTPLEEVKDLAIHYVGNPNTTAIANRNYFNMPGVEVSSHFIVGLEGEIVQCLPLNEKSAATNQRNIDTISIEVCHPDETGKFSEKTYASLIKLCAWLCRELHLDEDNLIRHYDVTGKLCPLYYVEHEDAWEQLKADVGKEIDAWEE